MSLSLFMGIAKINREKSVPKDSQGQLSNQSAQPQAPTLYSNSPSVDDVPVSTFHKSQIATLFPRQAIPRHKAFRYLVALQVFGVLRSIELEKCNSILGWNRICQHTDQCLGFSQLR